MNVPETMAKEEVTEMLADMGLRPSEEDRYPAWQRWKCHLMGPHEWAPVYQLDPDSGALIEDGAICCICRKEEV